MEVFAAIGVFFCVLMILVLAFLIAISIHDEIQNWKRKKRR